MESSDCPTLSELGIHAPDHHIWQQPPTNNYVGPYGPYYDYGPKGYSDNDDKTNTSDGPYDYGDSVVDLGLTKCKQDDLLLQSKSFLS